MNSKHKDTPKVKPGKVSSDVAAEMAIYAAKRDSKRPWADFVLPSSWAEHQPDHAPAEKLPRKCK